MITLKNNTKRMKTYNLDRHHGTVRKFPQVRELAGGGSIGEVVKRKLPDSLTFLAGEIKSKHKGEPLPASIKDCPEIKSALARGDLTEIKPPKRPTPSTPQPPQGNQGGGNEGGNSSGDDSGDGSEGGDSSGSNDGGNDPDPATVASAPTVGDDSESSESTPGRTSKKKTRKRNR